MNARTELFEFVLDQAAAQPPMKRARLYRALAEYCGDPAETRKLRAMAKNIEQAEQCYREFIFTFKLRAKGGKKKGDGQ